MLIFDACVETGEGFFFARNTGAAATMAHDSVVTPLDVVKQRMQVYHAKYPSIASCVRTVWREEGFRAFYKRSVGCFKHVYGVLYCSKYLLFRIKCVGLCMCVVVLWGCGRGGGGGGGAGFFIFR